MRLWFKQFLLVVAISVGFFCFVAYAKASSQAWQFVGNQHFSSGISTNDDPIAIGPDGTLYVAYADDNNNFKANVMQYNGSSWEYVGNQNFSSAGTGSISMAISATGTIYVAYVDAASSSRAMVMKYSGSSWVAVGNEDFSTSSIRQIYIAVDPYGTPYVAFIAHGDSDLPEVMKLNGTTWGLVGTPYSVQGGAPSMVFSSTGTPYVAVSNIVTGEPTVLSYTGSAWYRYGGAFAYNLQGNCPIAIDRNNTLYMAVADAGTPNNVQIYSYSGGSWNQVGSDYVISNTGNLNIKVSASGTPFVSLLDFDDSRATVISYDGSSWAELGSTKFTTTTVQGSILQMAINSSDVPYVAYSDAYLSNYTVSVYGFFPPPPQPTRLAAALTSPTSVTLSWTAPVISDGDPLTGYMVERAPLDTGVYATVTNNTGSVNTGYTDSNLSPRVYLYRVSSRNEAGAGTASSQATVLVPPPAAGGGFVPVTPSALGKAGSVLTFTLNDGSLVTTKRQVKLDLNADPETVRWYAVSVDPTFAKDSLIPFNTTSPAYFFLPNTPGKYTIYLKYYSTTGVASSVMKEAIIYKPDADAKASLASVVPVKVAAFTRVLRLGSIGADVKALQQFLNGHGFVVAKSGVGSPGHETNYYGLVTAKAVAAFQNSYAEEILKSGGFTKGAGIFGESTMKKVNGMK